MDSTMRYVIEVSADHNEVRLGDRRTGEALVLTGTKALYDALGILADWRERDQRATAPASWYRDVPFDQQAVQPVTDRLGHWYRGAPDSANGCAYTYPLAGHPGTFTVCGRPIGAH